MSDKKTLRQQARLCRSHAYEVPDAGSRNELLEEAEGLEGEAGGTRQANRDKVSPAVTAVAVLASVAIVVAVAALPVMAIVNALL